MSKVRAVPLIPDADRAQAEEFISAIHGSLDISIHVLAIRQWQLNKKDDVKNFHMTFREGFSLWEKLNKEGYNIYVNINPTDGKGRKDKNITGYPWVYFDKDEPIDVLPNIGIELSLLVETSRKKWQGFISVDGIPNEREFRKIQAWLINKYQSDKSVVNASQMMRFPGFHHVKNWPNPLLVDGKPFMSRIHQVNPENSITNSVLAALMAADSGREKVTNIQKARKSKIKEGSRNTHLTSLAGESLNHGLTRSEIFDQLCRENDTFEEPLPEQEIENIIKSSTQWDANVPVTEIRVSEQVVARHKKNFRSIPSQKIILRWTGKYWAEDYGEFNNKIISIIKELEIKTLKETDTGEVKKRVGRLLALERTNRIESIRKACMFHPDMVDEPNDYDIDPYLLNTQNGTIDIRHGGLRDHSQDDKITKITPCGYGGDCPTWIRFQHDLAQGDQSLIDFRQMIYGLAAVGENPPQKMFIEQGPTATGKTTLQEVIKAVLGPYAKTLPVTLISGHRNKSDGPSPSFADLDGIRAVFLSEFEEDATGNASALKLLNSEETISARQLYRGNQEIKIRATFYAASNFLPKFAHDDPALKRRLQIIPSTKIVDEKDQNPNLQKELICESSGILEWMVNGYRRFNSKGLQSPSAVSKATSAYWSKMDVLRHWYEDRCVFDPESQTSTAKLYFDYRDWCREENIGFNQQLSRPEFARKLSANSKLTKTRFGNPKKRGWKGIGPKY